jgi:hypothetical protein
MAGPQKIIVLGTNNLFEQYTPVTTSAGATDAYKVAVLGADGVFDDSMIPNIESTVKTAKEAIAAGAFVNIVNVNGTAEVQNANATDTTKLCVGFVKASAGQGDPIKVYFDGPNSFVPLGSFTAADINEEVFLSTVSGLCCARNTTFTTGQAIQKVGTIIDVDIVNQLMTVLLEKQFRAVA